MVRLDNPYPPPRPALVSFIPVVLLYIAGYFCFRYTIFALAYQYALTILVLILLAFLFDRDLLTSQRLFDVRYSFSKKRLIVLGAWGALAAVLWLASHFLFKRPVLADFYGGAQPLPAVELSLILVCIVAPFEEVFFRAYLQHQLTDLLGKIGGYLVVSLLYGLFFLLCGGAAVAFYLFVIGLFFGLLFMRSSSLTINIALRSAMMIVLVSIRF